jgi:hypothetical protein
MATAALASLALAAPASAITETFNFTGAAQTWTVPAGVTEATFDLYGAQGGGSSDSSAFAPGFGGRATATLFVTPGASIQVNVGGQGVGSTGGFNGGGDGATGGGGEDPVGHGGGGASDIRIGGTDLDDRALVAGGGGGAGSSPCGFPTQPVSGGAGGGASGDAGLASTASLCAGSVAGGGGTQTVGGSAGTARAGGFGVGGDGGILNNRTVFNGGGGGGGWWGGGGGLGAAGGGGGSGFGPFDVTEFQTGVRAGDGLVTITFTCGTITGTPANDRINGTAGDDVICGLGGKDKINGLGGDDVLLGGDGDDRLWGESGADELVGGSGRDYASFASGAIEAVEVDLSTHEVAHDGRGFADTITEVEFVIGANNQVNTLTGDAAGNRLIGGFMADSLSGGDGDDALRGEPENAGAGVGDTLNGGNGADRLYPGLGANTTAGGAGSDTLDYSRLGAGGAVDVNAVDGSGTATGAVNDTFTAIENLTGTPNFDTLVVRWAGTASFVRGRGGNDDLDTVDTDALDTTNGGDGDDTCVFNVGETVINCE